MATSTLATPIFNPADPPADPQQLQRYLREYNSLLSATIDLLARKNFPPTHVEPTKPRDGDPAHADGTNWNPGSGKGLYLYKASTATWVFVIAL